jgi:hypothetical protein
LLAEKHISISIYIEVRGTNQIAVSNQNLEKPFEIVAQIAWGRLGNRPSAYVFYCFENPMSKIGKVIS